VARALIMRFPRADGFLYCITLRFGVYCVCLYDTVSGVFDVVGSVTTLMYPEIMLRSQVASSRLAAPPVSP
jgi:hypothetical protein